MRFRRTFVRLINRVGFSKAQNFGGNLCMKYFGLQIAITVKHTENVKWESIILSFKMVLNSFLSMCIDKSVNNACSGDLFSFFNSSSSG